jgi:geranylgeranylglycerol-phosphate geranylgeranyltransferase
MVHNARGTIVYALFMLSRPVNVIIAMLSIGVAALIAGALEPIHHVMFAVLAGGLLTAGANAINDVFDVEIDRVNKPARPLPQGLITLRGARRFAWTLFSVGICLSGLINPVCFLISILAVILLVLYSAVLKRMVFWGNAAVGLLTGMAFCFGAAAVDRLEAGAVPAVFAFLMHLGREVIKDMEDVEGDRKYQANTLPVRYGLRPARILVSGVLSLLVVLTWLPWVLGWYGKLYLIVVFVGVNTVLIYSVIMVWLGGTTEHFRRLSGLLKADMIVGLIAIYLGSEL